MFLTCAQNQYFYDGNKRAGQYLMNGARLVLGLPVVTMAAKKAANIAAKKALEYNSKMIRFYEAATHNAPSNHGARAEMKMFLRNCRVNG